MKSTFNFFTFAVLFACFGCGDKIADEGEWCGTTYEPQPESDPYDEDCHGMWCGVGEGLFEGDGTETTRCRSGLTCAPANICLTVCPDRMAYDCVDDVCECEFIYQQLGENCAEDECDEGLLCWFDRTFDEPEQICVEAVDLFCATPEECEFNICRPNGLCADRLVDDPCQSTEQCVTGICRDRCRQE